MDTKTISDYQPGQKRLVCIDSDGCAFDTMEIKHKECFCPATVHAWNLQPISKYVREAWEFGNLYSRTRGFSRFHELCLVFDLLADRDEVKASGFTLPDISAFRKWVASAPQLNNACLQKACEETDDPVLRQALRWSLEMNERAAFMVYGIPPFPGVRESLIRLAPQCDIAIVSATPREALEREWAEHDLMRYVHRLCAQEDGTKKECIHALKPYYTPGNVLMIGDAPGDLDAAHSNEVLFYPIRPGEEMASWREFEEEDLDRFLQGGYAGEAEQKRIERFNECLRTVPLWKC
ncbi:MAG TPA: HAD hydrolase-like protein [Eubacteriales bacterium]|nr:HAD hydrolase-like protein [Eubacteriales bacterium]